MLTGIAEGNELTIDPSRAEARGDDYPIDASEELSDIVFVDLLTMDGDQAELASAVGSSLEQGLVDRLVGVLELDVLTD